MVLSRQVEVLVADAWVTPQACREVGSANRHTIADARSVVPTKTPHALKSLAIYLGAPFVPLACLRTPWRSFPGSLSGLAAAWNWSSRSLRSATSLPSLVASGQAVLDPPVVNARHAN
jgi:hypothetical protein